MNHVTAEIFELEEMLREAHIRHQMGESFGGFYVSVLNDKGNTLCKAICNKYSYGYAQGLLEIIGGVTEEEIVNGGVVGYLTAEEVFERFKYCYEYNTTTYGECTGRFGDLAAYYNSWEEGDSITVTADLIAAIGNALQHIAGLEAKIKAMEDNND